ncbi:MAG: hypothetical protein LBP63_01325 [Prevotellaceae bacterium]|jgi:hypothetical protein|nr:hypothetical protein [Prevotellaceae bacterium]
MAAEYLILKQNNDTKAGRLGVNCFRRYENALVRCNEDKSKPTGKLITFKTEY